MKKYLTIIFMAFTVSIFASQGWTPISKEQAEYNAIQLRITQINAEFAAYDASRSSSRQLAIFELLKNIGSPIAYKTLQELVANGELDKSFLTDA